jgi:hypothetical protein
LKRKEASKLKNIETGISDEIKNNNKNAKCPFHALLRTFLSLEKFF